MRLACIFFFQAEAGIRDVPEGVEFRRVCFRSGVCVCVCVCVCVREREREKECPKECLIPCCGITEMQTHYCNDLMMGPDGRERERDRERERVTK